MLRIGRIDLFYVRRNLLCFGQVVKFEKKNRETGYLPKQEIVRLFLRFDKKIDWGDALFLSDWRVRLYEIGMRSCMIKSS